MSQREVAKELIIFNLVISDTGDDVFAIKKKKTELSGFNAKNITVKL